MSARYKAEKRLARSLTAEILLARDQSRDGAKVVIKRLLPMFATDKELIALFDREIAVCRNLDHPNIVKILDAGKSKGIPFIVMEHLDGVDLRTIQTSLRKKGTPMDVDTACAITAAVARALAHAHSLGITHRDVSPDNIFLTRSGEVKLLDFGIARATTHLTLTRTGFTRGKRGYMSPEQLTALDVGPPTDVFALGTVLWELLTLRRLWKRESEEQTTIAIRHEPAPPPSGLVARIPTRLDALVLAMLAKLAASRPATLLIANTLTTDAALLTSLVTIHT